MTPRPRARCTAKGCMITKDLKPVKFPNGTALYCPTHFHIWDVEQFTSGLVIRIVNDDSKINQAPDGSTQPKLF